MARPLTALRLRALDALDVVRGRRDPLVPPRRLRGTVGDTDFVATGEEIAELLVTHAGLAPDARVLDVGCGIGRVARALTSRLGPQGAYAGFDVSASAVAWCARRYARRHPHFAFAHLDVRNALYNPGGAMAARDVRFPYPDGGFDVAVAASVLTHLPADETDRYLSELARVLRPGGRLLATFFLLDDAAREAQARRATEIAFPHEHWPASFADAALPESAVAYDEAWVRERMEAHGLTPGEPLRGSWSGRPAETGFQDAIVATR
ncbi:MAG TPA: class I SAM-dependent methyltransferase [Solirubrobacteraceae bacterium]|nr:class I SAM-dependent methyltransferase [Solirubrobacteraceae bacterium]